MRNDIRLHGLRKASTLPLKNVMWSDFHQYHHNHSIQLYIAYAYGEMSLNKLRNK
jgi:hypothetical protein